MEARNMYAKIEEITESLLSQGIEPTPRIINAIALAEQDGVQGAFNIYEFSKKDHYERSLQAIQDQGHSPDTKRYLEDHSVHHRFKNQILRDGLALYLSQGQNSVANLRVGNGASPLIPSISIDTQQEIQAPVPNVIFPKAAQPAAGIPVLDGGGSIIGIKNVYTFIRPATSFGGTTVDEIGVVVQRYDASNELLCRVVARGALPADTKGTVTWLPHTFSSSVDTIITWEIQFIDV